MQGIAGFALYALANYLTALGLNPAIASGLMIWAKVDPALN
ncbi:hypothetical protein [Siphonobacter sp. SORGH_AS_0500]|nr:hypothetical protein [Siphonobacter sp. SORGH_AS_0500]MDR6195564.1 hypothetical protein [Siphonobacter sp. SORGH_AS_0500]